MNTELACADVRAAVSALLDGEEPGVLDRQLVGHLHECAQCERWRSLALQASAAARQTVPLAPDSQQLTARVLTAVAGDPDAAQRRQAQRVKRRALRVALAATALGQLLLALPLLGTTVGPAARLSWETGSLNIAIAVGFGYAALRPTLAVALLPIAVVLAVFFLTAGVHDVSADPATMSYHAGHLVVLLQAALLWSLARIPLPRPSQAFSLKTSA
ncbi:MAG: hypothetical protein DLM55_07270 [Acidimicrobiales bacterium]|nr:MAG: hypothetical protein DLM55_07270 [Acidimicrobiales bacterium]